MDRLHPIIRLLCLLALVGAIARLFIGVDFTDEGLYLALPYRLLLGDSPFRDDLMLHQTSALTLVPPLALHLTLVGNTTAVLLVFRVLYFIFAFAAAWVTAHSLRPTVGLNGSVIAGTAVLTLLPFWIPSLSYNSIASLGFCMSGFLRLIAWPEPQENPRLGGAAALDLLVCIAYPPLCLAVLVAWSTLWLNSKSRRPQLSRAFGVTLAPIAFLLIVLWVLKGDSLRASFFYTQLAGAKGGGWTKVENVTLTLFRRVPVSMALAVTVIICCLGKWRARFAVRCKVGWVALLLFPLLALWAGDLAYTLPFITLLAPIFLRDRRDPGLRVIFLVWFPAIVAGVLTAWTSTGGANSFGIGALGATAVALGLSARGMAETKGNTQLTGPLLAGLLVVCVVGRQHASIYRDVPAWTAGGQWITVGPHAGLRTSGERAAIAEALWSDLEAIVKVEEKVLIYDNVPAAYLYSRARPAGPTTWIRNPPGQRGTALRLFYLQWLKAQKGEILVVRFLVNFNEPIPAAVSPAELDLLDAGVKRCTIGPVLVRKAYEIRRMNRVCLGAT